jgi:hypothetical protein
MVEIAYFEFAETWGGQSATWTRLHNPACVVSADYYGVNIHGEWHTLSIEERRALAVVMQSAVHFHAAQIQRVTGESRVPPNVDTRVWTGKNWSET